MVQGQTINMTDCFRGKKLVFICQSAFFVLNNVHIQAAILTKWPPILPDARLQYNGWEGVAIYRGQQIGTGR